MSAHALSAAPLAATIMLVEDERSLRDDVTEELQAAGYGVLVCDHGEQALALLASHRPDLILCDIGLPVMDGYALLDAVHTQRPDLADVPFIFLTAQAAQAQVLQGKRAGADDYLVKPIDFDLMLATLEARLRQVQRLRASSATTSAAAPAARPDAMQQMLDSLTVSLLLLDARGEITLVNKMAADLLGLRPGQNVTALVEAVGVREPDRLRELVWQGIAARQETARCLALPRAGDDPRDLLITVCTHEACPQDGLLPTTGQVQPAVSVIVTDPRQRPHPPVELLHALYDLTPAEAKVAWAFAQGKRSEEIAAAFHISPTTVAFHKRNIFLKTQTNRQADLIALMLSLPVV